MTTLQVTIGNGEELEQKTIERIRAAEVDERLADEKPVRYVKSYATLPRFLTERSRELLEVIADKEPASIREAAAIVD